MNLLKISIGNLKIKIDIIICVILCAMLLNKEIEQYFENYFVCFLFTIFHELAHIFIANIFGKQVDEINITISGLNAHISDNNKLHPAWILIYLAGPLSNLCLAFLTRKIHISFAINMALFLLNMLPIYPLDGLNILNLVFKWCLSNNIRVIILKIISVITIIILIFLGILTSILYKNYSIMLIGIYVINIYINYG